VAVKETNGFAVNRAAGKLFGNRLCSYPINNVGKLLHIFLGIRKYRNYDYAD
jgi:hypothetical protein